MLLQGITCKKLLCQAVEFGTFDEALNLFSLDLHINSSLGGTTQI
jgi:hypothetical protein